MKPPEEVENILFIVTDQQRKDSIGAYGNTTVDSPNIDKIAESGVKFERAYTPSAICGPTRASLLTGVKPFKHKLVANMEREVGRYTEFKGDFNYYPEILRSAGLNTGLIGKWHIGKDYAPKDFGFDGKHYPGWAPPIEHEDYKKYLDENNLPEFEVKNRLRGTFPNGQPGNVLGGFYQGPKEGTFTYFLAERSREALGEYSEDYLQDGKPFYLTTNFYGPHLPYFLPEEYLNMYDPDDIELPESAVKENFKDKPEIQLNYSNHWALNTLDVYQWKKLIAWYLGYVKLIDEQIGRILEKLVDLGILENTAIFFASDHGGFVTGHKLMDKGPMMYEDIYNVPFIAKIPGLEENGSVNEQFVSLLDLIPTFIDIAGGRTLEEYDGESLFKLWDDDYNWRDEITTEFHGHHFDYPQRMILRNNYKLIVNPADRNEFYDLDKDPNELDNRISGSDYSEIVDELYARLYKRLESEGDNFYHWMETMYDIDIEIGDTMLSSFTAEEEESEE